MADKQSKILGLLQELTDNSKHTWTRMMSHRDAADMVLMSMAELGLIEHREHVHGGHVWIFDGQIFGRTDGVELPDKGLKPLKSK